MSLTFHWFLPTNGDSRHVVGGGHGTAVTATGGDRPPSIGYLTQIARAAEDLGFTGALAPGAGPVAAPVRPAGSTPGSPAFRRRRESATTRVIPEAPSGPSPRRRHSARAA